MTRAIIAEARRFPGQEKQVIEYYQKSPEALNQLRAPIYEDKVIDFILELAQVSERRTTPGRVPQGRRSRLIRARLRKAGRGV